MTDLDTNVSNYTLSELMAIIGIDDLQPEDILENTNYYINKYKTTNPRMSIFFKEIQIVFKFYKSCKSINSILFCDGYSNCWSICWKTSRYNGW